MSEVCEPAAPVAPAYEPRFVSMYRSSRPTLAYWMETEVHVYAFSIAANVLLSFFPFLIVIFFLCREVLGWHAAGDAINIVLQDYFPDKLGNFIKPSLLANGRSLQMFSVLLLLFTANGIFEPLEVALNHAWGIAKNRSFIMNQMVSLGLIFACGTLGLASTVLTGMDVKAFGDHGFAWFIAQAVFKIAAAPITILMLFLIYWLLPNARVSWRLVLPPAFFVGLALEAMKYINILTWPLWQHKLQHEYGPFYISVTILMWSFLGSMIILAGAEWAARRAALVKTTEFEIPKASDITARCE